MTSIFLRKLLSRTAVSISLLCIVSNSSPVKAQAPALDLRCAYVDIGAGLYGEPTMHCFDMQFACPPGHTWGCFKRELVFEEGLVQSPGEPDRRVTAQQFGFSDKWSTHWDVPIGYATDGASIPPAFKPFIGGSWSEQYVPAAVLHDFYIRRLTSAPETVHRLFFHALLAKGVAPDRAKLMYWAVRNFGPQWKSIDLAAYEKTRQEDLERIRRENEAFEAEYSACLERHLEELRRPSGEAWGVCPLDGKHQFILDFMTIAADEITKAGNTIMDDLNAGRCVEEAPGKYFCP